MSLTKATYSMIQGEIVNVFDYMTPAEIADVQGRTGALDVTAKIQAAFDTRRNVFMPAGKYRITDKLKPYKQQFIYGEGGVERSYLNEPSVTQIYADAGITAFDFEPNIAIGAGLFNLAIVAADSATGDNTFGVIIGTRNVVGGSSQGIKCQLENVYVRGFDTGFGLFGYSWEITLNRCFSDYARSIGFHVQSGVTIGTMTDCSVLQAGNAYGTSPANGSAISFYIDGAEVYMHSPRSENALSTGYFITNDARVVLNNPYNEGNRVQDVVLDDNFKGQFLAYGGRYTHDNDGVTTFAAIKNDSTNYCDVEIYGATFEVGLVYNNQITCGFYYSESTLPRCVIHGLNVKGDVAKMSAGNAKVMYLSQANRYAPNEFSFANLGDVVFKRSGTTHVAHYYGSSLPSFLNISDGTNSFNMLTTNSFGFVNGTISVYDSGTFSWTQIAP